MRFDAVVALLLSTLHNMPVGSSAIDAAAALELGATLSDLCERVLGPQLRGVLALGAGAGARRPLREGPSCVAVAVVQCLTTVVGVEARLQQKAASPLWHSWALHRSAPGPGPRRPIRTSFPV